MAVETEYCDKHRSGEARRFSAKQHLSAGHPSHFHRNMEIYGVVRGKVSVTVADQNCVLTEGQMAVINGLENHSFKPDGTAEVFVLHIGTVYTGDFYRLYPQKKLPRWLLDAQHNRQIMERIRPLLNTEEAVPELQRIGVTCQLLSDIIEYYGVVDRTDDGNQNSELMIRIIQYVHDHYSERITLDILAKKFYLSPKTLSKKMKKYLDVDFRVFVNDIRVQRVVQMRDDPEYRDKPLSEIAMACGFNNMGTFYRSYERNFRNKA